MKRLSASVASLIVIAAASTGTASAQGLEALHSQRVEGNRVCFTDHFHSGSSGGEPTRAAAEKAAISSWAGFTAWEYGNHWGSWRLAASRSMNCSQLTGSWGCQVEARPCRPAAGTSPGRPKARAGRPKAKAAAAAPQQ